ncbi:MAG: thiamine phosphate synthase, partial [Betaproteobacteria bacterium]
TKLDAAAVLSATQFAELVAATALPVVAIGGINTANCAALFTAGAKGVAVVSAICGQDDPGLATRNFLKVIQG